MLVFLANNSYSQGFGDSLGVQEQEELDYPDYADDILRRSGAIDTNGFDLSASWFDLSTEQQELAKEVVETMLHRRMGVRPYLSSFTRALYYINNGDHTSSERVSEFLGATKEIVRTSTSGPRILQFFKTCTNLFKYNALFYGKNSKVIMETGSISIAYEEDKSDYAPDMLLEDYEEEQVADDDTTFNEDFEDDVWGDDADYDDDSFWEDYDDNESDANYDESDVNILDFGSDEEEAIQYTGPKIVIEDADFLIETPYDTTSILGTSGNLGVFQKRYSGSGGTMNWEKHGFEEDVYVELGNYEFPVSRPGFSSENSKINYPEFFDDPIEGVYTFKSIGKKKGGKKYPRFHSYGSNYQYKTISDEVDFKGGFNLVGKTIHSASMNGMPSEMKVSYEGKTVLVSSSKRYYLIDSVVRAKKANVKFYLFEDSLTHKEMEFEYGLDDLTIKLYWPGGPNKYLPMMDSYHRLEIVGDKVWYTLGDNQVHFGIMSGRSEAPMKVRSDEIFDDQEYDRMRSLYGFNPINMVYDYSKKKKLTSFNYREVASRYKKDPKIVLGAMVGIAGKGYIDFDRFTGEITVTKKTKHSFKSRHRKEDYDNLEIYSVVPTGRNGYIDLDSGIFYVYGVHREIVSKGLGVYFMPDSGLVKIYKGRDFTFDGRVIAGNYEIVGKDFDFNYNSFLFKINHLDSINFTISDDSTGQTSSQQILGGSIKNTAGTLYLNEIDNKSGLKSLPQYPILDISSPTYVYFDGPNVLGGTYNKEVYFEIPSFRIDSVESDNPNVVHLEGVFHSGGMIPDIETKLVVMPDLSLGFDYEIPDDGFEIYGSSAKIYENLSLDRGGLQATGFLTFMAALVDSDTFVFYQDSMFINNGEFEVAQGDFDGISFPHAKTTSDFTAAFKPKTQELFVRSKKEEIELYDGIAMLDGTGIVTTSGMKGRGIVETTSTKTFSKNYLFEEHSFVGHNSKFKLETDYSRLPGLMAVDVKMTFDFLENTARVEPEKGAASLEMPILQMKTSIPVGVWDLETHMFTMSKPNEIDIEDSYFYSTNPELDSLAFSADSAVYDVESGRLNASGVPNIYVADANIIPGDGELIISEEGEIEPLEDASIIMDYDWQYHYLTDASVEIFSAKEFDADAIYKYDNGSGDTMDVIFEGLHQEQTGFKRKEIDTVTIGLSEIFPEDNFYISPKIIFQGAVDVYANEEFLRFDGEIRLDLRHSDEFNDWLPFKWSSDPNDIVIEIEEPKNEEDEALYLTTGLHYDPAEEELYYTFLSAKRFDEDDDVFKSLGLLGVNPEEGKFEMGDRKKIEEGTIEGNLFTYDDSLSNIEFEGEFSFAGDEFMDMVSVGEGRANIDSANYTFQTLSILNFPIPNSALNEMGKELSESTEYVDLYEALADPGIQYNRLAQFLGETGADNFEEQLYMEYLPLFMASPKLAKGILLADLKFAWHKDENAFYNYDTIGLASILKNDINSRVNTYLEIRKGYNGSTVNFYVGLMDDSWYYLSYADGIMRTFSSNYVYNDIIQGKQSDGAVKEGEIELALATQYEVLEYITHFNNTYLNNNITEDDLDLKVKQPELESGIMADQKKEKDYDDDYYDDEWNGDDDWADDEFGDDDGWGDETEEDESEIPVVGGAAAGAAAGQAGESSEVEKPVEDTEIEDDDGWSADEEENDGWGADEEDDGWGAEEESGYDDYYGAPPPSKKEKKKKEKKQREPKEKKEKKPKEEDYYPVQEDTWDDDWGEDKEEEPAIIGGQKQQEEEDDPFSFEEDEEDAPVIINKKEEVQEKDEEEVVDPFGFEEDEEEAPVIINKQKEEETKPIVVPEDDEEDSWGGDDWGEEDEEEKPVIISQPKEEAKEAEKNKDLYEEEYLDEEEEIEEEDPIMINKQEEETKAIIVPEDDEEDSWGGDDWGEEDEEEKPVIITQPKEEAKEAEKNKDLYEEEYLDDEEEIEEEAPIIISQPKEEKEEPKEEVIEKDDFFEEDEKKEEKKAIVIPEDDEEDSWGGDDWGEEDEEEKPVIISKPKEDPVKEEPVKEEPKKEEEQKSDPIVVPEEDEEDSWDDGWGEEDEEEKPVIISKPEEEPKKEEEVKKEEKVEDPKKEEAKKEDKEKDPKKEDDKKKKKDDKKKPIVVPEDVEEDDWGDDDDDGFRP